MNKNFWLVVKTAKQRFPAGPSVPNSSPASARLSLVQFHGAIIKSWTQTTISTLSYMDVITMELLPIRRTGFGCCPGFPWPSAQLRTPPLQSLFSVNLNQDWMNGWSSDPLNKHLKRDVLIVSILLSTRVETITSQSMRLLKALQTSKQTFELNKT